MPEEHKGAQTAYIEISLLATRALNGDDLETIEARAEKIRGAAQDDTAVATLASALVDAARRRRAYEVELRSGEARLADAQRIGHMGSYDWDIVANTNTWSDELYRIYGTEPQSFNASYERFLDFIHPDDRQHVMGVHQRAYETGQPYEMEERIVRADGEERRLLSWGEVVVDDEGKPQRMRGTCQDVTDQHNAEHAIQRALAHFETLVESAPDALLLLNSDGVITQANGEAGRLFGYDRSEVIGHKAERVLIGELADKTELTAIRRDGTRVPVEVSLANVEGVEDASRIVFVRNVEQRKEAEATTMRLHDFEVRRRHALEINDNVVQGLTASVYAFESRFPDVALSILRATLKSARLMMDDLLGPTAHELEAGELIRAKPAPAVGAEPLTGLVALPRDEPVTGEPIRVFVIDDAHDIRVLLRYALEGGGRFSVIGTAPDGADGIAGVGDLLPDIVLLDLAMPKMDGLAVVRTLRERHADMKIVVLSGFDRRRTEPLVLAAGADAYIEKGMAIVDMAAVLATVAGRSAAVATH